MGILSVVLNSFVNIRLSCVLTSSKRLRLVDHGLIDGIAECPAMLKIPSINNALIGLCPVFPM
jgi:hypothetical protein